MICCTKLQALVELIVEQQTWETIPSISQTAIVICYTKLQALVELIVEQQKWETIPSIATPAVAESLSSQIPA